MAKWSRSSYSFSNKGKIVNILCYCSRKQPQIIQTDECGYDLKKKKEKQQLSLDALKSEFRVIFTCHEIHHARSSVYKIGQRKLSSAAPEDGTAGQQTENSPTTGVAPHCSSHSTELPLCEAHCRAVSTRKGNI